MDMAARQLGGQGVQTTTWAIEQEKRLSLATITTWLPGLTWVGPCILRGVLPKRSRFMVLSKVRRLEPSPISKRLPNEAFARKRSVRYSTHIGQNIEF